MHQIKQVYTLEYWPLNNQLCWIVGTKEKNGFRIYKVFNKDDLANARREANEMNLSLDKYLNPQRYHETNT